MHDHRPAAAGSAVRGPLCSRRRPEEPATGALRFMSPRGDARFLWSGGQNRFNIYILQYIDSETLECTRADVSLSLPGLRLDVRATDVHRGLLEPRSRLLPRLRIRADRPQLHRRQRPDRIASGGLVRCVCPERVRLRHLTNAPWGRSCPVARVGHRGRLARVPGTCDPFLPAVTSGGGRETPGRLRRDAALRIPHA